MINTGCCELMEVFELTIEVCKKAVEVIETAKGSSDFPTEAKELYKKTWLQGSYYFAFLTADKLWKEDRLCPTNCEKIYHELAKHHEQLTKK